MLQLTEEKVTVLMNSWTLRGRRVLNYFYACIVDVIGTEVDNNLGISTSTSGQHLKIGPDVRRSGSW